MTTWAIGDLHGCLAQFDDLLQKIAFTPGKDQLWLVGDLINRGPDSQGCLERVYALRAHCRIVLGNHDLHLLGCAAGLRRPRPGDTLDELLAPECAYLIDWLRQQPFFIQDPQRGYAMAHAGIPPCWDLATTEHYAQQASQLLQADNWRENIATFFQPAPALWQPTLTEHAQIQYCVSALTRMRFIHDDGHLDHAYKGAYHNAPDTLTPWFDARDEPLSLPVVFGHWAALGLLVREDIIATDSGCVWGDKLSAVALDDRSVLQVDNYSKI